MILPELCAYLQEQGIGICGTTIFYGPVKEEYPDAVVVVQESGGSADEPDLGSAEGRIVRVENPEVIILVRGAKDDYDTPRTTAELVRNALAAVVNDNLSGTRFLVAETRPVAFRQFDNNFRNIFGVPARIMKVPG